MSVDNNVDNPKYSRRGFLRMVLVAGGGLLAGCNLEREVPVVTPTDVTSSAPEGVDIPIKTPTAAAISTSLVVVTGTATLAEIALPVARPEASLVPTPGQLLIVRGTGGIGARLRKEPSFKARIVAVVPEYSPVTVVGSDRLAEENVWRNVMDPKEQRGWLPSLFLSSHTGPVTPQTPPVQVPVLKP